MKNQLYYGDNLAILRQCVPDESVALCYIDPPFNSKRTYNQIYNNIGTEDKAQAQAFLDTWTWNFEAQKGYDEIIANTYKTQTQQSIELLMGLKNILGQGELLAYLVSMTQRIAEIYRVLQPTGSFYLHCDPTASHYLKLVLDCIFCARGGDFKNEITWKRYAVHSLSKNRYDAISDIIFFYTKTEKAPFKLQYENLSAEEISKKFPHTEAETGRRYQHVALEQSSNKQSVGQERIIQGRKVKSALGWRWTQETFDARLAKNPHLIYWTETGKPRYKIYADEYAGRPVSNIWTDVPYLSASDGERLGYPTQKPEALLERIIKASSNEGDVVLDCYCGCGTSIAVAEKLKRKWIGIDITYQSISVILKRFHESFGGDFTKDLIDKETKQVLRPAQIQLVGVPQDFAGALALANRQDDRVRKEFEKWFVLRFSNNQALINDKKGGDGGIDGIAYLLDTDEKGKETYKKIIFSVKSSKTLNPSVIRDLAGTLEREQAAVGYLLTLYPMPNLEKEATKYGNYESKLFQRTVQKIQVIDAQMLFDGELLSLPTVDVLRTAERKKKTDVARDLFEERED